MIGIIFSKHGGMITKKKLISSLIEIDMRKLAQVAQYLNGVV